MATSTNAPQPGKGAPPRPAVAIPRLLRASVLAVSTLLAAPAQAATVLRPESYAISHHRWLTPKWSDTTGNTLTDGESGSGAHAVILRGTFHADFVFGEPVRLDRVAVHAFRGNKQYLLDAVNVYAREQGAFVPVATDTRGYRGDMASSEYVYELTGLGVRTDTVRVEMVTPNLTGLTEVVFHGTPSAGERQPQSRTPIPLSSGLDLVAREGVLDGSGGRKVLIENRFVQLLVDPQRGGIVESVVLKPSGRQLTFCLTDAPNFPGGLFEDHDWDPYYSYAQHPYSGDLRQDRDQATVVLRGRGQTGKYGFTEIVKTMRLHRDRASLDVSYEFRNDPSSMTEFSYAWWIHHCLASADEPNTYFVPSTRGIRTLEWAPGRTKFDAWVYNVSRGWSGVIAESGVGTALEVDFSTLNCFYTCFMLESCTLEWRLNRIRVAPGESIRTEARVLFLNGLRGLAGARHGLAGDIAAAGAVRPGAEATVTGSIFTDRARKLEITAAAVRLADDSRLELGRVSIGMEAGESKSWQWRGNLQEGTHRLFMTATDGDATATFERALTVGKPDAQYTQEPESERIGLPGPPGRPLGSMPRHDLSHDIETAHVKWAKPLPGGPIRAFVLVDVSEQREIVELAQRVDMTVDTVKIRSQLQGAADYQYRGDRSITNLVDAQDRILDMLGGGRYDLLVFGGMDWEGHFTEAIRNRILEQVLAGAGLVWVGPGGGGVTDFNQEHVLPVRDVSTRSWAALKLPTPATADAVQADRGLARLIPLEAQGNLLAWGHADVTGDVHMTAKVIVGDHRGKELPVLVTGAYGKGRTAVLAWGNTYNSGRPDVPGRLLPCFPVHKSLRPAHPSHRYWEELYALFARVVVWTANRETAVRLTTATVSDGTPAALQLAASSAVDGGTLRVLWQDENGAEVAVSEAGTGDAQTWELPLPQGVPAGPGFAYVLLRDREGCALDWAVAGFLADGPVRLESVDAARPFIRAGEAAEAVAVVLQRDSVAGLRVESVATDGYGRLLGSDSVGVAAGRERTEVPLTCPGTDALGGQLNLEVCLRDDARIYAQRTVRIGLTRIAPKRGPRLVVWGSDLGSHQPYINALEARRALDLGMDAVLDGWNRVSSASYPAIVQGGVQFHPLNVLSIRPRDYQKAKATYNRTHDKGLLVRKPCLDDPDDRRAMLESFRKNCEHQLNHGGALDYCLGDEMSLSHYADYFDYCFHPSTLRRFREWLSDLYPTLDALNAEWGTQYAQWSDVAPMTYAEAKEAENPAAWADFRTYMEIALADFLAHVQTALSELDPNGAISLSGTQSPVAGNGMDWWRMSRAVPIFHSYNTSNMCQARRSFSPWQCDEPWFGGYWQEDPKLEWNMWWCLYHNCSGVSAWYTPIFFYPDFTYTESGRQLREHWQELKGGIWQQVRALRIERPRVAVHYSQASIHATFLRGRPTLVHDAWEGWLRTLEDLAIPYDFVAYEQIEQGLLDNGQYRVLVLPASVALSDKEVDALQRFVEAGNLVVADTFPGVVNDHCRPLAREALYELFGAAPTGPAEGEAKELRFTDGTTLPWVQAATTLELRGAQASGASEPGHHPVQIHTRSGKGQTVLLNFELSFYQTARRLGNEQERAWRRRAADLLRSADVEPAAGIELEDGALPHAEVVRYLDESGQVVLVGVLNGLLPKAEAKRARITLPGTGAKHVYDVRAGRSLAVGPALTTVLHPGEPKLYAILDQAIRPLEIGPGRVRRDKEATVDAAFIGSTVPQTVRYGVTDASGRPRREYSGVVTLPAGRGSISLPLAPNDPKGAWSVRLTHVLTGVEHEQAIQVE